MNVLRKAALGFGAWLAIGGSAIAAPCAGFSDVDTSSGFCPHVEWVKNRVITTGCTLPGAYCPNDYVTRLQMAAFLRRTGDALAPAFVTESESGIGATINANGVSCQTDPYVVQNYPRVATATAMAYHKAATPQMVTARIVYSTDGGSNWGSFSDFYTLAMNVGNADGFITQAPVAQPLDLEVGETVLFGIRFGEFGPQPTVNSDAGCSLTVRIESRTGSSTPLDARARPVQRH
jgi:hypothetical protein